MLFFSHMMNMEMPPVESGEQEAESSVEKLDMYAKIKRIAELRAGVVEAEEAVRFEKRTGGDPAKEEARVLAYKEELEDMISRLRTEDGPILPSIEDRAKIMTDQGLEEVLGKYGEGVVN